MDAFLASPAIAHSSNVDGAEDGFQAVLSNPPLCVKLLALSFDYPQGRPHIAVTSLFDMGLKHQSLNLASFVLLLPFDLMQRPLESLARGQPGLQFRKSSPCLL